MPSTHCPNCDAVVSMDNAYEGARVRCPGCCVQLEVVGTGPFDLCFPFLCLPLDGDRVRTRVRGKGTSGTGDVTDANGRQGRGRDAKTTSPPSSSTGASVRAAAVPATALMEPDAAGSQFNDNGR